jgi:hypothetical protein
MGCQDLRITSRSGRFPGRTYRKPGARLGFPAQFAGNPLSVPWFASRRRISADLKFAVVRQATVELLTRHKISAGDGVRVPFGRGWRLVRRAVAGTKAGSAGAVAPWSAPGC